MKHRINIHLDRSIEKKQRFRVETDRQREGESIRYTYVIKLPIGGGMGHFETELSADSIKGTGQQGKLDVKRYEVKIERSARKIKLAKTRFFAPVSFLSVLLRVAGRTRFV